MTNYDDVATESTDTPYQYGKGGDTFTSYKAKVWNANPQVPDAPSLAKKFVVAKTVRNKTTNDRETTYENIDSIRAVILFSSPGRRLGRGTAGAYRVVCESFDGETPALKIKEPLCRKTTTEDLVRTFSQWKGYDKAKVDLQVADVTENTGCLQICGLKSRGGFINLCKYGKKDPDTGQPAACKQNLYIAAYDIDRDRQFVMELTGNSIAYGKFIAPIHEFFSFLIKNAPEGKSLPSYAFTVDLSALAHGANFILSVTNWQKIEDEALRERVKALAFRVKEGYDKKVSYIPNETKTQTQNTPTTRITPLHEPVVQIQPKSRPIETPVKELSFEEDDIPF